MMLMGGEGQREILLETDRGSAGAENEPQHQQLNRCAPGECIFLASFYFPVHVARNLVFEVARWKAKWVRFKMRAD